MNKLKVPTIREVLLGCSETRRYSRAAALALVR
jgi:hypothetical protein